MPLPLLEFNGTLPPPSAESTLPLQPHASCTALLRSNRLPCRRLKGVCMQRTTNACLSVPPESSTKPMAFSTSDATMLLSGHECLPPSLSVQSLECATFHPPKQDKRWASFASVNREIVHIQAWQSSAKTHQKDPVPSNFSGASVLHLNCSDKGSAVPAVLQIKTLPVGSSVLLVSPPCTRLGPQPAFTVPPWSSSTILPKGGSSHCIYENYIEIQPFTDSRCTCQFMRLTAVRP